MTICWPTRGELAEAAAALMKDAPIETPAGPVDLVDDQTLEIDLATTLLYGASHYSYRQIARQVAALDEARRNEIIALGARHRGRHDELLREFSAGQGLRFDILMDIGGFRDMHRHRRCIQILQSFTNAHGYEVPEGLAEAGLLSAVRLGDDAGPRCLRQVSQAGLVENARYVLPLGTRTRALFKMDFAEALYIAELRSAPAGHFSYRRIAWEMYQAVARRHPALAAVLPRCRHPPAGGPAAAIARCMILYKLPSLLPSFNTYLPTGDSPMADDRSRAIDLALAQIEKQFGKGSIMRLGNKEAIVPISVISTGSISFDAALGVGGVPRGRVIEIFGPESSGKTTITLQIIAEAQKAGGMAAFVDAEHALDPQYAKKLGVDVDNLLVSQPDYGEQALEITEALVRSGAIDVLVVDSVAALVPKAELDGEMGDSHMGLQARLMSQALRKLTGTVSKSRTSLIFINQIREKIGVMFGNPETTTGGRALKFYSSVRIDIRRIAAVKEGDVVVGSRTKIKVVKNKVAAPFREAEFDILYGEGISREGDVLDLAVAQNIVEKSGAWYSYAGERIGQGRENVRSFLKDHPEIFTRIDGQLRQKLGLTGVKPADIPAVPINGSAQAAEAVKVPVRRQ